MFNKVRVKPLCRRTEKGLTFLASTFVMQVERVFFMQVLHYDARSHAVEYPSTQKKQCLCKSVCVEWRNRGLSIRELNLLLGTKFIATIE